VNIKMNWGESKKEK